MVQSRSDLSREDIRRGLAELIGQRKVCVDEEPSFVQPASTGSRSTWRSMASYDGPIPAAIVSVRSTAEVAKGPFLRKRPRVNVVPRTGDHCHRRWP